MSNVNRYTVYSTGTSAFEQVWSFTEPLRTPSDGSNTLDPLQTTIDDTVFLGQVLSLTTTPYSLTGAFQGYLVNVATGTINLPSSIDFGQKLISFFNTGTTDLNIVATGTEVINATGTLTLTTKNCVSLYPYGFGWITDTNIMTANRITYKAVGPSGSISLLLDNSSGMNIRNMTGTSRLSIGLNLNGSLKSDVTTNDTGTGSGDLWSASKTTTYVGTTAGDINRSYLIQETKASGSSAGDITASTWTLRNTNSITYFGTGFTDISLTGTVPSSTGGISFNSTGTYLLYGNYPCKGTLHRVALVAATGGGTGSRVLVGSSSNGSNSQTMLSELCGKLTVTTAPSVYQIYHFSSSTRAIDGLGLAVGIAGVNELFSSLTIQKFT